MNNFGAGRIWIAMAHHSRGVRIVAQSRPPPQAKLLRKQLAQV